MAANDPKLVTVFGGSGFVGRHIVRALARRGHRVRVAVRRPDLANFLQPIGAVGQIHAVQANLRYPDSVARAIEGADAVVNAVGILYESGKQRFGAVQATGAKAIAEAAKAAGVTDLVHISAIGADAGSKSDYAKTKAAGEKAVFNAVPEAIVLRPSIVFGPEDDFFNRFAAMARISPVLPLIGGGHTRFQPVFVGDVAAAAAMAVSGEATSGAVYELGGPQVLTFAELMEMMLKIIDRKRLLLPVPLIGAKLTARVLELLPKPLLTCDQVLMLQNDNVVGEAAIAEGRTLAGLGITPETLAAELPSYLYRFRARGQFEARRSV
ncbi:MAG TPA: complex I NDUFA9 subunit family protein [Hyphomicrobiales bacterium]|nr:complex I NDUFA9 subunit family protein [Hyphomicrobiales bacterium]